MMTEFQMHLRWLAEQRRLQDLSVAIGKPKELRCVKFFSLPTMT
jgi:hypothetical protein